MKIIKTRNDVQKIVQQILDGDIFVDGICKESFGEENPTYTFWYRTSALTNIVVQNDLLISYVKAYGQNIPKYPILMTKETAEQEIWKHREEINEYTRRDRGVK